MEKKNCTRICSGALGLGFGIASGLTMLFFALAASYLGYGSSMVEQYSSLYHGYAPTVVGALIGGLWGFVQGFIFGFVVGCGYNLCARCCRCGVCCPTCTDK